MGREYYDYAKEYITHRSFESFFPSELFWDYYINECHETISLIDIPYLFESYKSRNKINEYSTLSITVLDDQNEAIFETFRSDTGDKIESYCFSLIDVESGVSFNKLSGVTINGNVNVELHSEGPFVMNDSSIECHSLTIQADQLEINISNSFLSYLMCETNVSYATRIPRINLCNNGMLYVNFPNAYSFYELAPFLNKGLSDEQNGIESFTYKIKRIFSWFRQHKKDTLAKDYEKIDNHVVQNKDKRKAFDFLVDRGVIYREDHLYKVNKEKMKECGISYYKIDNDCIQRLYSAFIEWNKNCS